MTAIRRLLAQRHVALLLCAATLALKLLVPTGYMIANGPGGPAIVMCSGMVPGAATMSAHAMPMAGHGTDHDRGDHGKPEMPCAFAGLSHAAIGTAGVAPIAAPMVFAAATNSPTPATRVALAAVDRRPPSRGPPAVG